MDPLSVILASIAGALFAIGYGPIFSRFSDDYIEPDQPLFIKIGILIAYIALFIVILVRLDKLGYSIIHYIFVIAIIVITNFAACRILHNVVSYDGPMMDILEEEDIIDLLTLEEQMIIRNTPLIDEKLNSLIEQGEYLEARKYLGEMLQMSLEMGDHNGHRMYKHYEAIITETSMEDKNGRHTKK